MEKDIDIDYNLFKVPAIEITNNKKKVIAGLIDASGSMGSYWKAMVKFWNQSIAESAEFLITFSHIAKLEENPVLSEDLKKHGGGMTNIYAAFEKLEERLMEVDETASITIVFISDGQDTVNGEHKLLEQMKKLRGGMGRDITMLCLGIQSGFPTKISMDIRELYHTGDQKIPALYLIQYASQKAFFNKFETMSNCFKVSNEVRCLNAKGHIKQYPWEKETIPELKENKWVMIHNETKIVAMQYNKTEVKEYKVTDVTALALEDVVDCFRGWVQKVQLMSMDVKNMKQTSVIADETAQLMCEYTKLYEKAHNLFILSERPFGSKETFKERASSLAVKNVGSRIKWFVDELRIIAKGVGIGQLNEYEAAKRIGIGTITGKYHQKALALKGITVKDFEKIKEEFTQTFKHVKLSEVPSKQQVSIFTLQNQKQIFQQPDFLDGLRLCGNQYDLVQSFPIVGYSLKVKRYDGSMINPWKVRVLQLAKTHNSIDSVYLANNSNKYQLNVGQGKVQEINAILPLFGEEDVQMSPLFNTKLFKLAVSFMVVQNIDTYHEEAYLALLASTFVFLLKEPQSQWRDNLIKLIHTSLKVTYWQTQEFKELINKSLQNPLHLFTAKGVQDHTDITKVMLLVFFIGREHLLPPQKINHYIDLVMVHYAEKTYVENEFKLSKVANLEMIHDEEQLVKKGKTEIQSKNFSIIKSFAHLKQIVDEQVSNSVDSEKLDVVFDPKIFLHNDEERRVTFEHIKHFYEGTKKEKLHKLDMIFYFGHSLKGKSEEAYNTPIQRNIDAVKKQIFKQINVKELGPNQGKKVKTLKKMIQNQYVDIFQKAHFGIVPITLPELQKACDEKGINIKKLQLNPNSGMIANACMSPNCKFYLQPLTHAQFSDHMRLWKKTMPARFHLEVVTMIKDNRSLQEIYAYLINSGHVNLKKNHKSKEDVMKYIELIRNAVKK